MKIRRTIQEIKDIVEKYNKSGLSKTQFCTEQKLSPITFYKWVKKINSNKNKLNFTPVSIKQSEHENILDKKQDMEKINLKIGQKILLEFPKSISSIWLSSLLKELV